MSTLWTVKDTNVFSAPLSPAELSVSPLILNILSARGLTTAGAVAAFLNAEKNMLQDPFLLGGMAEACACLLRMSEEKKRILIHGDYDVDGVTAAAIMHRTLDILGADFMTFIPQRKDGYGFGNAGLRFAAEHHADMILTLDCGITSAEEVTQAKRSGLFVIIVDHHQIPPSGPPPADAIINPWLNPDSAAWFTELSAAGLAFKLSSALIGERAFELLDIAATGTVADVAPLVGENRILVREGLRLLTKRNHAGFAALLKSARLKAREVTARHIGFVLGPRLNAGGRMDTARAAYEILTTREPQHAESLAATLEVCNSERRKTEKAMVEEAIAQCEREVNFNHDRVIVLWNERWHAGVIGIVAARLVDRFYRPAIVISLDGNKGKGSARSIRHFHIHHALEAAQETLIEFGGHEMAGGFVVAREKLAAFRAAINVYAHKALLPEHLLKPLDIDAEISLAEINEALARELAQLAPFGCGNPEPLFLVRNLHAKHAPAPRGRYAWQMWVTDGTYVFEAVGKREQFEGVTVADAFDLVFSIDYAEWAGAAGVVLEVRDIKPVS